VFDILRGFLPAGVTTQLSWHTNLRQAHDKISLLDHHPLKEVASVSRNIHTKLKEKYPNSFGHTLYDMQEVYRKYIAEKYTYFINNKIKKFTMSTNIRSADMKTYKDVFAKRPIKTNLPHFISDVGNVTYEFLLDFGSFRDIQRHRNGVCRMPLLTTKLGFQSWYLDQLPKDVVSEAKQLIKEQIKAIGFLSVSKEEAQYYVAMGFNVACRVTYGLPAAVYTMELRSGKLVHATLRVVAHEMYRALKKKFPSLTLHADLDLDDWDIRRGLQDIKEKK